jgi:mitogen-activated protein kinase kinase kinase 5
MVVRGESFATSAELNQIALVLNALLGRKGNIDAMNDYWDVATYFEMTVLCEDYTKACQAARKMYMLDPPPW